MTKLTTLRREAEALSEDKDYFWHDVEAQGQTILKLITALEKCMEQRDTEYSNYENCDEAIKQDNAELAAILERE